MLDYTTILFLVFGVLLGIALVLLIQSKRLNKSTMSGIADLMKALPATEGSGVFDLIYKYSRMAVLAVEQLVASGKLGKSSAERKSAALDMVKSAAEADKIHYGKEEGILASACIEAEVHKLPRNKGTVSALADMLKAQEPEQEPEDADENEAEGEPEHGQDPEPEPDVASVTEDEAPGVTEAPPDEQEGAEE